MSALQSFELEPLDVTEVYFDEIDRIACENVGALETVGGNLLIHVFGVGSRTVVTSGPRKGMYPDATDEDTIDCLFCVQQWVLLHLLEPDPDRPIELEQCIEDGSVVVEGDIRLYHRFMRLGRSGKNALSIRAL